MKSNEYEDLSEVLRQASQALDSLPQQVLDIIDQFSNPGYAQMMADLSDTLAELNSQSMTDSLNIVSEIADSMSVLLEQVLGVPDRYIRFSKDLRENLANVFNSSVDFTPPEWRSECEGILSPSPARKAVPFLTFDRAVALLGLLISLFSFLVTQLPDAQLDELIDQNEQIITAQSEELELERQRTEQLQDLVQDLSDVIVELHEQIQTQSQQIETLGEQLQGADDLPESPAHRSQPNSLNQDADTQD